MRDRLKTFLVFFAFAPKKLKNYFLFFEIPKSVNFYIVKKLNEYCLEIAQLGEHSAGNRIDGGSTPPLQISYFEKRELCGR